MNVSLVTLHTKEGRAYAQTRDDILRALSPFAQGDVRLTERREVRACFQALAEALGDSDAVALAVEDDIYLQVKELFFRAVGLQAEEDAEIAALLQARIPAASEADRLRAHAQIAQDAVAFPSEDGLYSGFGVESAGQLLLFLPLDLLRIKGILRDGVLPYLAARTDKPVDLDTVMPAQEDFWTQAVTDASPAPEPRTLEQTEHSESTAALAVNALNEAELRLAVASTPTAAFLRESAGKAARFDDALVFTDFMMERGGAHPNEYAAQLAKGALEAAQTPLGASITNIFTSGREADSQTFIYIAVADRDAARVRRLFSEPGEHPSQLIAAAVDTLYEMIADRVLSGPPSPEDYPDAPVLADDAAELPLEEEAESPRRGAKGAVIAIVAAAVVLCIAFGVYFKFFRASALEADPPAPATDTTQDTAAPEPEAADAILVIEPLDPSDHEQNDPPQSETAGETHRVEGLTGGGKEAGEAGPTVAFTTEKAEPSTSGQTQPPPDNPSPSVTNGVFTFTVYGYGHGVGMSQYGANEYAKQGWDYRKILAHYYPGTQITNDTSMPTELVLGGKRLPTREAIACIVEQEVGPSFQEEAIKAQAVAAYTYVVHNGESTSGVAYAAYYSDKVIRAVDAVLGQYVTYNGRSIDALFFSMSAGKTASAASVWGGNLPYLAGGVDSPGDKNQKNYQTTYTCTAEELKALLENGLGVKLTGDPSGWLEVIEHDRAVDANTGYVSKLRVGDIIISGHQLRMNVLGTSRLRSHCFAISYRA